MIFRVNSYINLPHPYIDMDSEEDDGRGGEDTEKDETQDDFELEKREQLPQLGDLFVDRFTDLINHEHVRDIRETQSQMLHTLELSNSKLASLNNISEKTYEKTVSQFRHNIKMLQDMKKQLDSIFRRIRVLKGRVAAGYPQAYAAALEAGAIDDPDNEDTWLEAIQLYKTDLFCSVQLNFPGYCIDKFSK